MNRILTKAAGSVFVVLTMLLALAPWKAWAQGSLEDDWLALVELYDSTEGDAWWNNDNWSNATDTMPDAQTLDSWYGVTVDMQALRVSELRLDLNDLFHALPPEIGNLTHLKHLSLGENELDGEIPPEIGKLTQLEYLSLWSNNFVGDVPAEIWTLTELRVLNIGDNYELGTIIPPEVGNLTGLDTLIFSWSKVLSGRVPEQIGNLVNLRLLDIQQNQLTGKLPTTMTNMSQLTHLNFKGDKQRLCAPRAPEFQAWLRGVDEVYGPTCRVPRISSHIGARIACAGGQAAEFECNSVDLLSHLSMKDMGAEYIEGNDIWGWTDPATNREYALVGRENSVGIVDVTDQINPVYLGSLPSHDPEAVAWWRDMKVYRDHMYVVADAGGRSNGMQVFDLTQLRGLDRTSLPVTFDETANYQGIGSSHNVFVHEETGYAYLVGSRGGHNTSCGVGLHIVDVRDPVNPTFAGCHDESAVGRSFSPGYVHDVQCVIYHGPDARYSGKEICVASSETAINIVDVTNKSNTVSVAIMTHPLTAYSHQGWFTEDHRYFIANDELDEQNFSDSFEGTRTLFWDLTDLDDPVLLTEYFDTEKTIDHNLYVRENYVYLSNYESGLRILDIEDISNPVEVAYFDTDPVSNKISFDGAWSSYPYFKSGIVIVSSTEQGLFVLKPTTLSITATEQDALAPLAFTLHGNYPNPFNPSTRITFNLPVSAQVQLQVFDMKGRSVAAFPGKRIEAGARKSIEFSGEGLASGTYVYRLTAVMEHQTVAQSGVMTLVR